MEKTVLTYIGRRVSGTSIGYYYLNGTKRIGFSKKLDSSSVGSLIEVTYDEKAGTVKGPYIFKGRVTDQSLYTEYCNADESAQLFIETEKQKKKAPDSTYDKNIEELRKQYLDLPGPQKLAFLVRIQRDISKAY